MPDLKSQLAEVKHKLATMAFDDEGEATETPEAPRPEGQTQSRAVWLYIKDNPGSTIVDVGRATGVSQGNLSSLTTQLFNKGALTRVKPDDGGPYKYTVADPNYKPLTKQQALQRAIAAKNASIKKAKAKAKPKAKPKAEATPTQLPPTAKFSATIPELLDTLSVVQARALYDELKKIFGA
jgi:predicted transcriptional regulator